MKELARFIPFSRRKVFLLVMSVACIGCRPSSITLVNPKTKEELTCSAQRNSRKSLHELQLAVEKCAKELEAVGYIRFKNLTPEQKDSLKTR